LRRTLSSSPEGRYAKTRRLFVPTAGRDRQARHNRARSLLVPHTRLFRRPIPKSPEERAEGLPQARSRLAIWDITSADHESGRCDELLRSVSRQLTGAPRRQLVAHRNGVRPAVLTRGPLCRGQRFLAYCGQSSASRCRIADGTPSKTNEPIGVRARRSASRANGRKWSSVPTRPPLRRGR
jgi:hypothetical protein